MADELDAAMARVESKSRGRTRYEGQPPYDDELMLAEITRLRTQLALKDNALREAHAEFQSIRQATLDGKVCDDVAWYSDIETLHDFCWDCEGKIEKLLGIEAQALSPSMTDAK